MFQKKWIRFVTFEYYSRYIYPRQILGVIIFVQMVYFSGTNMIHLDYVVQFPEQISVCLYNNDFSQFSLGALCYGQSSRIQQMVSEVSCTDCW